MGDSMPDGLIAAIVSQLGSEIQAFAGPQKSCKDLGFGLFRGTEILGHD